MRFVTNMVQSTYCLSARGGDLLGWLRNAVYEEYQLKGTRGRRGDILKSKTREEEDNV